MLYKYKKSAFTLIELLVVIAIIGMLATISVIALQNARAKSRDAKRAGDMKQVQTALELFFNDNNRYPTASEWESGQIYSTSSAGTSTYLQIISSAPSPSDGGCTTNQNTVSYYPTPDGASYSISICLGNTTGTLTPGPKCLTPGGIIDRDCSCGDDIVDSRDSQSYPTVKIGGQCWLAKNMNIGTKISSCVSGDCTTNCASTCTVRGTTINEQTDDGAIEKYCYNDDTASECATYGGMYQLHEALQLPYSCDAVDCATLPTDPCCSFSTPIQGICPTGWHVPSDAEQNVLDQYLTDVGETCDAGRSGYDCNTAGDKLKEAGATHWTTATSTNSTGFTALASGFRNPTGSFGGQGTYFYFRASSVSGLNAYRRGLSAIRSSVARNVGGRTGGISVRCLRD